MQAELCLLFYVYYPREGKKPLSILQDSNFEELGFQTLFPTGQFGYPC